MTRLLLVALLCAAAPLAAQSAPASAGAPSPGWNPVGRYALTIEPGTPRALDFVVTVTDSGGKLGGSFRGTSSTSRVRPLFAVVPKAGGEVVIQYADGYSIATMLLRVRGDSVSGSTEYFDATYPIAGKKTP